MTPTLGASPAYVSSLPLLQEVGAHFPEGGPSENCFSELLGERELSKLRWRCRRGLLENDLLIEKFFNHHAATLTVAQAKGLNDLMDLSDNDLLDLLLKRKEPSDLVETDARAGASTPEALLVLNLLRPVGNKLSVPV
jgi:antitoxin CptB